MKKYILLTLSIIVLIITIASVSVSIIMRNNIQKDIEKLNSDIKEAKELITNSETNKEKLETEYNELKEELKDKVDEYTIWENLKEKITK